MASLRSLPVRARGSGAVRVVVPLRISATAPLGASIRAYETPALARKLLAMSHEVESNRFLPIGSNWNEHCPASAYTVTGAAICALYSAGLAYRVRDSNNGK